MDMLNIVYIFKQLLILHIFGVYLCPIIYLNNKYASVKAYCIHQYLDVQNM